MAKSNLSLRAACSLAGLIFAALASAEASEGAQNDCSFDGDAVLETVGELASASCQGGLAGISGSRKAGDYIAKRLEAAGLTVCFQDFSERDPMAFGNTFGLPSREAQSGARAQMETPADSVDGTARNVIGVWNGSGGEFLPKLIYSAHYDHIGLDLEGSGFPGATDNASGTALLLVLADTLARGGFRGDIGFVFTGAEAENFSGAAYFTRHPPFTLEGIPLVNIDGVGLSKPGSFKVGYGTDEASAFLAQEMIRILKRAGISAEAVRNYRLGDKYPLSLAGVTAVSLVEEGAKERPTKADHPSILSSEKFTALGVELLDYSTKVALRDFWLLVAEITSVCSVFAGLVAFGFVLSRQKRKNI